MNEVRASQAALEVARTNSVGVHATQAALEIVRTLMAGAHASQVALEVVRANPGVWASQVALEVARSISEGARASQLAAEVVRRYAFGARPSQLVLEVARTNASGIHASQTAIEVARTFPRGATASQVVLEVVRLASGGLRASHAALEVVRSTVLGLRASQAALEVVRGGYVPAYVTQIVGEVLRTGDGTAWVTQVVGEVIRKGDARACVTQAVAEVLRTNAPLGGGPVPPDVYPWPFEPSLDHPVVERYGFKTDVRGPARDGSEQRALLRETPSGSIAFTSVLLKREMAHASVLLYGVRDRRFAVPLWQHQTPLLANASAGASSVSADTTTRPFRENGRVILWRDTFLWELAVAETVSAGGITLVEPLVGSWPAGTRLIPIVIGILPQDAALDWLGLSAGLAPVEFTVPSFYD